MKRLMAILVLVVAVPAMAAVNLTAVDATGGKLQIAYTTTDGDLPRGVALRIACDGGAMVDTAAAVVVDPAFNAFIDWAYSNPLNYAVGDGNPLAKFDMAGALDADAADFSVSMGVLDPTGNQGAGPASTTNLITIQLKSIPTEGTNVTISGDTLRGPASGVVGSVLTSNLPITVKVMPSGVCYLGPDQAQWILVGSPVSWCAERQCHGDANNADEQIGKGRFFVGFQDITILLAGFNKPATDPGFANWIAADFDHADEQIGKGRFRVGFNDITVLLAWFNKTGVPTDCQTATPVKP